MKVEAKEVRAKINKTNDDNLRQQMRHDKLMKVLNHRNGGQYDTFVDLLIKKEQEKRQRMKEDFERQDRVREIAGS